MDVGFIGYGNHAARLEGLLGERKLNRILKYHPNKKRQDLTNDLDLLLNCDVIFITSPNETHFHYLDIFSRQSDCYIFCEKPPATNPEQIAALRNLPENIKSRIFFNFNYRFSELSKKLKENFENNNIGLPMLINASISHGLSFKDGYRDSWRGNYPPGKSVVLDTVLIHLVDLFNFLLRNRDPLELNSSKGSCFNYGIDTFSIGLLSGNGLTINLFASYAAPYQFNLSITGTNGLIDVGKSGYTHYSPRDTFDENGNFTHPPEIASQNFVFEKDYIYSLEAALEYFLFSFIRKSALSAEHYQASLETMSFIFQAENQL